MPFPKPSLIALIVALTPLLAEAKLTFRYLPGIYGGACDCPPTIELLPLDHYPRQSEDENSKQEIENFFAKWNFERDANNHLELHCSYPDMWLGMTVLNFGRLRGGMSFDIETPSNPAAKLVKYLTLRNGRMVLHYEYQGRVAEDIFKKIKPSAESPNTRSFSSVDGDLSVECASSSQCHVMADLTGMQCSDVNGIPCDDIQGPVPAEALGLPIRP